MTIRKIRASLVAATLVIAAGAAQADSDLWLHVKVDGEDGEKISVNLPLSLIEMALPMIPNEHFSDGEFVLGGHWGNGNQLSISQLRDLWNELKSTPDMTFVTVEDGDETVTVSKSNGYLQVHANESDERVEVRVPEAVIDALLSGGGETLDIRAAVTALAEQGEGELVTVNGDDEQVRVWIDGSATSE